MIMTVLPMGASAVEVPASTTFLAEDIEEATFDQWNASWQRYDTNANSSVDTWNPTGHRAHNGDRSAYCARSGFNSRYLNSTDVQPPNYNLLGAADTVPQADLVQRYDTNQHSVMRTYLPGAAYYNNITLNFWFYSDTGASDAKQPVTGESVGYDFLNVVYYTGTNNSLVRQLLWTDTAEQASAKTWTEVSVQVPNNAIWVGFEFVSGTTVPEGGDASDAFASYGVTTTPNGATGMKEGVYVDDIECVGTEPVPPGPLVTSVNSLAAYQNNRSFPISYNDNDPLGVTLEWIYLYYRANGTETWTKYTNEVKPQGAFVSSPILFNATQDGTYEFFTQGKAYNGTMEVWRGTADASTTVDTTAPATEIDLTGNMVGEEYSGSVTITLVAADATSGVDQTWYRMDGGTWTAYSGTVTMSTPGDHVIDYYSTDMAGSVEDAKGANFTILAGSSDLPAIVFQTDGGDYPDGNITITFAVNNMVVERLEYSLDGGAFVTMEPSANSVVLTGLSEGEHRLKVRATDGSNNIMYENTTTFTIGAEETTDGSVLDNPILIVILIAAVVAVIGGGVWYMRRKK
jgi:hypothetical protein